VPVLDVVERIVVVVEEVPADDVVVEAIAIVVGPVRERDQNVLRVEQRPPVLDRTVAERRRGVDAGVARVVERVEDAIPVRIPGVRVGGAVPGRGV
jgi:hypothetical protein